MTASIHVFRLKPQQMLREGIEEYCQKQQLEAASLLTCVGSVQTATLRMAGGDKLVTREGPFEIVSLVGVCTKTGGHFHCSLSDSEGNVWGGHLCYGTSIFTTAEIVIQDLHPIQLDRQFCPLSGYDELVVLKD